MIRTVIIDDEASARNTLRHQLHQYLPQVEVVGEGDSVESGIRTLQEQQPDLVLLDIEMPVGSGFDILDGTKHLRFQVIFVTAYSQYALQAFRFSATAYLLKPVRITELVTAIEKAFSQEQVSSASQRLGVLAHNLNLSGQAAPKLVLPDATGFFVVDVANIIRCESDRNYTRFYFTDQPSALISKTMKDYEDMLLNHGFFRIHQSHLINLRYVRRYIRGKGGEVEMSDKAVLPVSRSRKDEFVSLFLQE